MRLREIFDEIDGWLRFYLNDSQKVQFFNRALEDLCGEKKLRCMTHENDTLATTSGTYVYALSAIKNSAGSATYAKAVHWIKDSDEAKTLFNIEGDSIVFDSDTDPGTATYTLKTTRYPAELTLTVYQASKAHVTTDTYTNEIPAGFHRTIIATMKYLIELDQYGEATDGVAREYMKKKQNFIADQDGSRETDPHKLEVDQYVELEDGDVVEKF